MQRSSRFALTATVVGVAIVGLSAFYAYDGSTTDAAVPPPVTSSTPARSISTPPPSTEPALTVRSPTSTRAPKTTRPATTRQTPPPPPVKPGVAAELRLPSLGVVASVSSIGLGDSLTLVPPSDYTTVGWWAQGAEPGAPNGTAILAGHTVHTGGGALDNLEDLTAGDQVYLSRPAGDLVYEVSSVTIYRKGTLADEADTVFAQEGPGRLAVVTCEDWNGSIYLSNVVVIASDPLLVP